DHAGGDLFGVLLELLVRDVIGVEQDIHAFGAIEGAELALEDEAIKAGQGARDKEGEALEKTLHGCSFPGSGAVPPFPMFQEEASSSKRVSDGGFAALSEWVRWLGATPAMPASCNTQALCQRWRPVGTVAEWTASFCLATQKVPAVSAIQ